LSLDCASYPSATTIFSFIYSVFRCHPICSQWCCWDCCDDY